MMNNLGDRIKDARTKAGFTQEELAKRLGIAYQTLNKYERGHRTPDGDILRHIAKETGCDPGWLLTGEGPMEATGVMYTAEGYTPMDDISQKILTLLKDMPEEARRDVLKYIEKEKLMLDLLEERKRLKDAG